MSTGTGQENRSPAALSTGELKALKSRSVQRMGNSENCLGVNLTEFGTLMLGITAEDDVSLRIYENGIWVSRANE